MTHRTRSGKVFNRIGVDEGFTVWEGPSEVLRVLLEYLDLHRVLAGRLVCQAWQSSFRGSSAITKLQLQEPDSVVEAEALGVAAALNFKSATTVRLQLADVQNIPIDLTADDDNAEPELFPEGQTLSAAGEALLEQLNRGRRLQQLQLVQSTDQTCTCVPALIKAVPQLRVLDLSRCAHRPQDLLVLAQHAPELQDLLLHCQAFTTLSGQRIRHGNPEWGRHGGNTRYSAEHIAALAHLPQLQLLEVPLPVSWQSIQQTTDWFDALGSLTSLTGLHVICHGHLPKRPPVGALAALSRLTQLKELACEAGRAGGHQLPFQVSNWVQDELAQAECWGTLLPCMPHLTRLELFEAAASDLLLCAIGNNAPQLQRLVLFRHNWSEGTGSAGAGAIAHVGHIELLCCKGFDCDQHPELLQLQGLMRVHSWQARGGSGWESQGGVAWTPETCRCWMCVCYRGAQAQ